MRLFVAVELPAPLVAAAEAIAADLRRRVHDQAPQARLTWVPPPRMHLTLRFLGEVAAGDLGRVEAQLAPPLAAPPVEVTLGSVGTFPVRGAPRVIWLGFAAGSDQLGQLARDVSARLHRIGIAPESRSFSPHLTLARVRDPAGLRAASLLAGVKVPDATGTVHAITLFESRLSPKGPTYTALQHTPLRLG